MLAKARAGRDRTDQDAARESAAGRVRFARAARRFLADRRGTTAIEYGMIGFLIFAVAAGGIKVFGTKVNTVYNTIGTTINAAQ